MTDSRTSPQLPSSPGAESAQRPPLRHRPRNLRAAADELQARRQAAATGDEFATQRRHDKGRRTARERIHLVLDEGSFVEVDLFARHRATGFGLERRRPATDGVITGWGTVDGRRVAVFSHDARCFGGALGETFAAKVHKIQDLAESAGVPIIGINDGGGARIQEGPLALAGFGGIFRRNVRASGVIPQISVVAGACAGGAAYSPALTDFVFMVRASATMFITGPDVVAAVTGEQVGAAELGGAAMHAASSGVASFVAEDEAGCFQEVRYLLAMLPANNNEPPPRYPPADSPDRRCPELLDIVPTRPSSSYDMRLVLEAIADDGDLLEVHADWARNIVCALGRLDGATVGFVGNQPAVLAGALDIAAAEKAARFVRMCDAFNIPLVTLVDVPGFLPGRDQEADGIVRRGAKLVYAYCEATVPRVSIVVRKAYGGAYIAMDSRSIGADLAYAWPSNEIAVMGAEGAASVIFRREIEAADDPERQRQELADEYADRLIDPYAAAERGLVDDLIDPADTRRVLIRSLALLQRKRADLPHRKHGNGPQ
jgi:acetyl-CoA carboxylase carboxyltransferase component